MANDAVPFFEPGQNVTGVALAAVTGKRFVQTNGREAGPGLSTGTGQGNRYKVGLPNAAGMQGAGKWCLGVAAYDSAIGKDVKIIRGGIVPVTAAAALLAGAAVSCDATGQVVAASTNTILGYLVADVASGADAEVALSI